MEINEELKTFIVKDVLPIYTTHDDGHKVDHGIEVIENALNICKVINLGLDVNMVFASAAFHDIGLSKAERKHHHMESGIMVRENPELPEWFTSGEIEMIAQACEDHRSSLGHSPRSLYGMVVSDADRTTMYNIEKLLHRTWHYRKVKMRHLPDDEIFEDMYEYMCKKYSSEKGTARLCFDESNIVLSGNGTLLKSQAVIDNKPLLWESFQRMRHVGSLARV